jgi:hypothetical protein
MGKVQFPFFPGMDAASPLNEKEPSDSASPVYHKKEINILLLFLSLVAFLSIPCSLRFSSLRMKTSLSFFQQPTLRNNPQLAT